MKRVLAIVVCALMLFTLCSCGGKDESVAGTQWELCGVELGGIEVMGSENMALNGLSGSISFDDSQFVLTLMGNAQTGTYTQKQDILTLSGSKVMFGVLNENSLVIEDDAVGTLYFEKQ